MKWVKAPEELKALLEAAMKDVPCEKRPMFGYPAYFINRHMFIGLFQRSVFIRLSQDQLARLQAKHGAICNLEPMPGKPMKDYYVLPESVYANGKIFKEAIVRSAEYTSSLPPKEKNSHTK